MAEVHQEVTRRLCCPGAVRVGGNAGQVEAAGTVRDDDQGVEAPQEHGVHVSEVDGEDAVGLGGQELLPGGARAAGRGVDPGGVQDLPDRGGRDRVAELSSSPCTRRRLQVGLSVVMPITSLRIEAAVDG